MAMATQWNSDRVDTHLFAPNSPVRLLHILCAIGDGTFTLADRVGLDAPGIPQAGDLSSALQVPTATWPGCWYSGHDRRHYASGMDFVHPGTGGLRSDHRMGQPISIIGVVLFSMEPVPFRDAGFWYFDALHRAKQATNQKAWVSGGINRRLSRGWWRKRARLLAFARSGQCMVATIRNDRHSVGQSLGR